MPGIDAVDWATLFHAYGTATDTREHLLDLARGDRVDEAVRHLGSAVVHQGTVWPATPDALRVVCAILAAGTLPATAVGPLLDVLTEASEVLRYDVDESARLSNTARQAWADARTSAEDDEEALELFFSESPEFADEWMLDAALRTRQLAPHVVATLERLDGAESCRDAWLNH